MSVRPTLFNIQQDLIDRAYSCLELVQNYLTTIDEQSQLNAFLEVFENDALSAAAALDRKISNGEPLGKLFGLVISIKDNISYEGHRVTAASKILAEFEAVYSATAVERLLAEDAIIIGRTNCDEFGMGSSNENSAYGPVLHPLDRELVSGGSSGGAAVSVAAQMCHAALGSDTGGSIRQPAAFCGVTGLKPTYGRVSRYGLLAYASSFDQIGPLARHPEDIARIMEVISGHDPRDATSSRLDVPPGDPVTLPHPLKIAYFKDTTDHSGIEPDVKRCVEREIDFLTKEGHLVNQVDFSLLEYLIPTYYVLTTAEASSNLARYDGAHYGRRAVTAGTLDEMYTHSRSEGLGKEVQNRIMLGTFVLSSGYYDAYYSKAQKVRRMLKEAIQAIFADHDLILMPTAPSSAFRIGEKTADPVEMYLADIFTVLANLTGIPAISLPVFEGKNGMPIGVQFMADRFAEQTLLSFAKWRMDAVNSGAAEQ